ncbi:MAG: hypothetical protein ACJ04Q_03355 [Flavobacteriales bacterium]
MKRINFTYYVPGVLVSTIFLVAMCVILLKSWAVEHLGITLAVTSVPMLFLFVIDRWLWHIKPFSFLLWVPDMRGAYAGVINYENDKRAPDSLKCQLLVRQSGSHISVESSFYKEDGTLSSPSRSDVTSVVKRDDNTHQLIFTYTNEGADHLSTHRGTNVLEFRAEKSTGKSLTGQYYTNRRTKGTLTTNTNL